MKTDGDGWRIIHRFERNVICPNCDYMGVEIATVAKRKTTGICTKCGHTWESDARPPKWFADAMQRRTAAEHAEADAMLAAREAQDEQD